MNLGYLKSVRAAQDAPGTMQQRTSNTLSGVLYSLRAHERITEREFEAYTRGLSIRGLQAPTYDELIARFGITYDADRNVYAFALPVARNLTA